MAATPPSNPTPSGAEQNPQPVPLTFQDNLTQFWAKNRMIVLGLCALVLLAIVGKGAFEWYQASQERAVGAAYAAATTPEQLRAFAAAHPNHMLAGVAELRIADEAYSAGKSAEAISGYDKALTTLKTGPLAARAQLGRALAKAQSGKGTEAAADLKQIVNDGSKLKAARAEAAYHLASLEADGGNAAEAQKYIDQLNQIDPASLWARRAMALQANLPKPAAPAAAPASAPAAKEQAGPNVQIKLPAK